MLTKVYSFQDLKCLIDMMGVLLKLHFDRLTLINLTSLVWSVRDFFA